MRYPSKNYGLPSTHRQLVVPPIYANMKSSGSAHSRRDSGPIVKIQRHRSRSKTVCVDVDGTDTHLRQHSRHCGRRSERKRYSSECVVFHPHPKRYSSSLPNTGFHTPTDPTSGSLHNLAHTAPHSPSGVDGGQDVDVCNSGNVESGYGTRYQGSSSMLQCAEEAEWKKACGDVSMLADYMMEDMDCDCQENSPFKGEIVSQSESEQAMNYTDENADKKPFTQIYRALYPITPKATGENTPADGDLSLSSPCMGVSASVNHTTAHATTSVISCNIGQNHAHNSSPNLQGYGLDLSSKGLLERDSPCASRMEYEDVKLEQCLPSYRSMPIAMSSVVASVLKKQEYESVATHEMVHATYAPKNTSASSASLSAYPTPLDMRHIDQSKENINMYMDTTTQTSVYSPMSVSLPVRSGTMCVREGHISSSIGSVGGTMRENGCAENDRGLTVGNTYSTTDLLVGQVARMSVNNVTKTTETSRRTIETPTSTSESYYSTKVSGTNINTNENQHHEIQKQQNIFNVYNQTQTREHRQHSTQSVNTYKFIYDHLPKNELPQNFPIPSEESRVPVTESLLHEHLEKEVEVLSFPRSMAGGNGNDNAAATEVSVDVDHKTDYYNVAEITPDQLHHQVSIHGTTDVKYSPDTINGVGGLVGSVPSPTKSRALDQPKHEHIAKVAVDNSALPSVPSIVLVGSRYTGVSDFDVIDQIGSGQFADVYLAVDKVTLNKVALKMCKRRRQKDAVRMTDETTLQMTLQDHPYIALNYGAFTAPCGRPTSVQEYLPGGDLLQRIPTNGFSELKCLRLFMQLTDAIQHIHDLSIVHRDIKNDNIVVDGNGNLRLIDFGFATRIDEAERVDYYVGTTQYMAPEILLFEETHQKKKELMYPKEVFRSSVSTSDLDLMACDVWSAGVVMFTMLTGRFPWNRACTSNDRFASYADGKIKQTSRTWQSFSWDVQTVLEKMLCVQPEGRWPARAILSYIDGLVS
eukprot:CFRG4450T1